MKLSEFQRAVVDEFGSGYGQALLTDLVLGELGGRTAQEGGLLVRRMELRKPACWRLRGGRLLLRLSQERLLLLQNLHLHNLLVLLGEVRVDVDTALRRAGRWRSR